MALPAFARSRARLLSGAAEGSRWEMALREPAAHLRRFVRGEYCGYTERTAGPSRRREFPGPFVVLVLEFAPPIRVYDVGGERHSSAHRGGFVAGLDGHFATCEHDGFQQGVQVNLTPIGARLFFGLPMSELSGRVLAACDLLPAPHRNLSERLQDLDDWDDRFDLLDDVLFDGITRARVDVRAASHALARIEESGGALDMGALARELGYSRKHTIALFHDRVGLPPKLMARIVRFDRLLQHLKTGGRGTWTDLALEFGYYDQAHLVRDVKEFSGVTPTQVRPLVTDIPSLLA